MNPLQSRYFLPLAGLTALLGVSACELIAAVDRTKINPGVVGGAGGAPTVGGGGIGGMPEGGGGMGTGGSMCNPAECPAGNECQEAACIDNACGFNPTNEGGPCTTGASEPGVCESGSCVDLTCTDNMLGPGETGVDCGGPTCPGCPVGEPCNDFGDCLSGVCDTTGGGGGGGGGPAGLCIACTDETDCQTGEWCDTDVDGGTCVPQLTDGTTCNAGVECVSGNCVEGVCCDSGCGGACDSCLMALNNVADGQCLPSMAGTTCDDGLFCNGADSCNGTTATCDVHAGDPCPAADGDNDCSESCNETLDNCTANDPNNSACDDGLFCNGTDTCNNGGSCANHVGNPCPGHNVGPNCADSCSETADNCTANDAATTSCDDGTFCNGTDSCNGSGMCVSSGNPCAGHNVGPNCDDSCNEGADDCTASDAATTSCDDGLFCTATDACDGSGSCLGTGNPCPGHNAPIDCSDSCSEANNDCTANDANGTMCDENMDSTIGTCNSGGTCTND